MKLAKPLVLLGCMLGAAWSAPALADVDATITYGKLSYTLTDLDPSDGIAPSLSFIPLSSDGYSGTLGASYSEWYRGHPAVSDYLNRSDFEGGPLSLDYVRGDSTMHASLGSRGAAPSQVLTIEDHLRTTDRTLNAYHSIFSDPVAFTLSANTSVTFHTAMDYSAHVSGPGSSFLARSVLEVFIDPAGEDGHTVNAEGVSGIGDGTTLLQASFSNGTSASAEGYALLSLFTSAAVVSPVPQPAHGAMLLAGLAVLGLVRRRPTAPGRPSVRD
ncbi:hypothetical protein [Massilia endophytica]|uniref:hypothetical protein n=1 Tax=Massilia endophytica TaxID=2899220 RepID=UPI001E5DED4E|nr:hypothetical protein [Massilia endophytica]UGQ48334.1 hypothetical protein LSQ66_07665 [Massilia endophytica]